MPTITTDRVGQKVTRQTLVAATETPFTLATTQAARRSILQIVVSADSAYHDQPGLVAADGLPIKATGQGLNVPMANGQTIYLYSTAGGSVDILVIG